MNSLQEEIYILRSENIRLKAEIEKLKSENIKWEHCHREDMADNVRLRNQVALLMGWDPVAAEEYHEQN